MVRFTLVALFALALGVSACAIPTENSVRPIAIDDVPPQLQPIPETTTPTSIPIPNVVVEVYFYRTTPDGEVIDMVPVERRVEASTPEAALRALFMAQPTEEEEASGLKSLLGPNATEEPIELIRIERIDENRIIIDVTRLPAIEADLAAVPWAQMVFTATQAFGNEQDATRVRFEEEGVPVPSLTESEQVGRGQTISRRQFLSYDPANRPPPTIPPTSLLPEN